nr:unnamed protein product [Callosobruchus analis]
MGSTENSVCQLCQGKLLEKGYQNSSSSINELANVLFLKWENSSGNNVICETCTTKMRNFCEFKFKCLLTEDKLHPYIKKGKTDIDLFKLLNTDLTDNETDNQVCRFCKQNFVKICTTPLMGCLKDGLGEVVRDHFPEINIGAVKDSVICKSCLENLLDFGQFTVAWSNNNFIGDWVNTQSPIPKVKDEKKPEEKIMNGLEIIKVDEQNIKRRAKWYSVTRRHKCPKCNYSHQHLSMMRIHEKIHQDKEFYKCGYCDFQSKHKGAIYTHSLQHKDVSEVKMYKCGECDFQAKIKCKVINHQRIHQKKLLKCTQCSFQTKYRESLGRHQILHKDPAELKMFKCEICSFIAKRKHNLQSHMLKHKEEGAVMYKCSSCKFQTKYTEALSRHKRLIISYLKKHLVQHKDPSELKLYHCNYCSYASKVKSQRNMHMKVAHNPPKFQCAICGYKCRLKNNLKNHIMRHHPRKQWSKSTF